MIERSRFRRPASKARCREVMRVLNAYLDEEVEGEFAAKIAEHLEDCRRCGLDADVYSRIKESLEKQPASVDPEAVRRLREFGAGLTD